MGDPIKFVNFYFPDNTHAVISMEDKPICKTTHLPQQQPLIFGHNLGPNFREHKFIYQPVCKVGCKTIKTWMLSLLQPDTVVEAGGEHNYGNHIESSHMDEGTDFNIHDLAWEIFGGVGIEREEVIDGKRLLRVNQSLIKIMNKHAVESVQTSEQFIYAIKTDGAAEVNTGYSKYRSHVEIVGHEWFGRAGDVYK